MNIIAIISVLHSEGCHADCKPTVHYCTPSPPDNTPDDWQEQTPSNATMSRPLPRNDILREWVCGWVSALRACAPVAVGEPRNIADPANRPFMESITTGECPAELDPGSRSQQVSVNLVRSEKPYEAPAKPRYKAFSGSGQTLAGGLCFVSCHCLHVERTATMLRLI